MKKILDKITAFYKKISDVATPTAILAIICIVVTLALSSANLLTKGTIKGLQIKNENAARQKLMDGAIIAVSECGLEGLTTRSIEQYSGMKDSYIYRYFEDKEDLLKKAFLREDETFIRVIEHYFPIMYDERYEFKERCYRLWQHCWKYLVSNPNTCKFYVRYYYSTYFRNMGIITTTFYFDYCCKCFCSRFLDITYNYAIF